jgi:hypothetical protein
MTTLKLGITSLLRDESRRTTHPVVQKSSSWSSLGRNLEPGQVSSGLFQSVATIRSGDHGSAEYVNRPSLGVAVPKRPAGIGFELAMTASRPDWEYRLNRLRVPVSQSHDADLVSPLLPSVTSLIPRTIDCFRPAKGRALNTAIMKYNEFVTKTLTG